MKCNAAIIDLGLVWDFSPFSGHIPFRFLTPLLRLYWSLILALVSLLLF